MVVSKHDFLASTDRPRKAEFYCEAECLLLPAPARQSPPAAAPLMADGAAGGPPKPSAPAATGAAFWKSLIRSWPGCGWRPHEALAEKQSHLERSDRVG